MLVPADLHVPAAYPAGDCHLPERQKDHSLCTPPKFDWRQHLYLSLCGAEDTGPQQGASMHDWRALQYGLPEFFRFHYNPAAGTDCLCSYYDSALDRTQRGHRRIDNITAEFRGPIIPEISDTIRDQNLEKTRDKGIIAENERSRVPLSRFCVIWMFFHSFFIFFTALRKAHCRLSLDLVRS
ncbi:hypothetical protein D3C75_1016000 [compost metagenome]